MTNFMVGTLAPAIIEMQIRLCIRDARLAVADRATPILIHLIRSLNTNKDNSLAWRLHDLADGYDTRPTGEWGED